MLNVCRSNFYYEHIVYDDTWLANLIMEIYQCSDCRYGYRKIAKELQYTGHSINNKKVLKIMQDLNIQGIYPKKKHNSTKQEHNIYPYLLENIEITRKDHVWATDITYIKLPDFFMYFTAVIDLYTRYIVSYDLSHSLEIESSLENLERALTIGTPSIFNTDQGCQYTSNQFINILLANNIAISMDHKGRCFDNILMERFWRTVKQECIYYYRPETISQLEKCLDKFIYWYNNKRRHQSLDYLTPCELYK